MDFQFLNKTRDSVIPKYQNNEQLTGKDIEGSSRGPCPVIYRNV
jgi:hypothetical protein